MLSDSQPASSRRAIGALGLAALLCAASSAFAQQTQTMGQAGQAQGQQQQQPQQQQPPEQPDPLKLNLDVPVTFVYAVKPTMTADFEAAWASILAAFGKATDPGLKAFGDTLTKLYRVTPSLANIPDQPGSPAIYVFLVETPSKTYSYNPVKIVYSALHNDGKEGGVLTREEADAIYQKLQPTLQSIVPWPLVKVGGMM